MKSTIGRTQWAAVLALLAMIGFVGLLLPGCAPAPPPEEEGVVEPAPQAWPEAPPEEEAPPAEEPSPAVEEEPFAPPPEEMVEPAPEPAEPAEPAVEEPAPPPAEKPEEPPAEKPAPVEEPAPAEKPAPVEEPAPAEKPAEPAVEEPAPAPAEKPEEPAAEKPAEEKPAEEKPAEEKPAEEKPAEEKPAEEMPAAGAAAVDPAKLSTYAPAEDLVRQFEEYLEDLEKAVENEADFADEQSKLVKDANVLILVGLAMGLHDQDNKYKQDAAALVEAAEKLAAVEDYAAAKAGVEAVKAAAASSGGDPPPFGWERAEAASMKELMEAVPLIHSRLKRYMRGSRFQSEAETTTGLTAVLAVVAQGSMPLAAKTEQPTEVEAWHKYCAEMRDAAAAVHATIVAQDEAAAEKAMEKLQKSCDDCHAIFHPGTVVE